MQVTPKQNCNDDFEGIEQIAWRMFILLPTSTTRTSWDWLMVVLVLYSLINTPLQICFADSYEMPVALYAFNAIVDFCFIFDVALNFRTAFYEQKLLSPVLEPRQIARNYIYGKHGWGGWFWPDLIAAIPFDWVHHDEARASAWLSFAKLGRLFRLSRIVKKFDQLMSAHAVRVSNFLILLLLCTHCMACLWWMVGWGIRNDRGWQFNAKAASVLLEMDLIEMDDALLIDSVHGEGVSNTTRLRELIDAVPLPKKYLTSLYWALTMVMKSPWLSPSIAGEQVYASFTVVIGAMLFAAFIGNFTNAIASYDKSNAIYRDSIATLRSFFKLRPTLSMHTRNRVFRYADAYFKQTIEGVEEHVVLKSMPEHLRPSVVLELHSDLVRSCGWMQELSFACCTDFLIALRPEILLAGDVLLRAGVLGTHFYMLQSGELKVTFPPEGARVSKLSLVLGEGRASIAKGSMMQRSSTRIPQGRIERIGSLIGWSAPHGEPRPLAYTVRASLDSSLYSIRRQDLATILDHHPLDASIFKMAVEHASKLINPIKRCTSRASNSSESSTTALHKPSDSSSSSSSPDADSFKSSDSGSFKQDSAEVMHDLKADRRCSTTEMMQGMGNVSCGAPAGGAKRKTKSSNAPYTPDQPDDPQREDALRDAAASGWLRGEAAVTASRRTTGHIASWEDASTSGSIAGGCVESLLAKILDDLTVLKAKMSVLEAGSSKC